MLGGGGGKGKWGPGAGQDSKIGRRKERRNTGSAPFFRPTTRFPKSGWKEEKQDIHPEMFLISSRPSPAIQQYRERNQGSAAGGRRAVLVKKKIEEEEKQKGKKRGAPSASAPRRCPSQRTGAGGRREGEARACSPGRPPGPAASSAPAFPLPPASTFCHFRGRAAVGAAAAGGRPQHAPLHTVLGLGDARRGLKQELAAAGQGWPDCS